MPGKRTEEVKSPYVANRRGDVEVAARPPTTAAEYVTNDIVEEFRRGVAAVGSMSSLIRGLADRLKSDKLTADDVKILGVLDAKIADLMQEMSTESAMLTSSLVHMQGALRDAAKRRVRRVTV